MSFPSQPEPWIGQLIGDRQRYRLEKRLGSGGMGDVFLAMDTRLGKQVALKLLKNTLVGSGELRKRFEREVALCAALKSDNIVEVSDYGVDPEGYPFYVMEYLRGQSLGQLMRCDHQISVERTVSIITQVCEGLHLAHTGIPLWRDGVKVSDQIKVVHRDLKPDNIFLVPTTLGELVKILDFGIAKIRDDSAEQTKLTSMFLGTYHYAAPEQLGVEKNLDGRADIYSLGVILYEMLTGTDPFGLGLNTHKISEMSWALAHASKPPVSLLKQPGAEQVSPELDMVVMRCLQKSPDERFASVDELNCALRTAVDGAKGTAQVPPQSEQIDSSTINRSLTPPQESYLLEILLELVGPIAPTLLRQVTAKAPDSKELVANLALYLSPTQRIEFEKAISFKEPTVTPQTELDNSPSLKNQAIKPGFVHQCEQYLTDLIGPIATLLIQQVLKSHPQISSAELVNLLAVEISNPQKAKEFSQRLLDLS